MDEKEKKVQIPLKTLLTALIVTDDLINGRDIDMEQVKELHKVINQQDNNILKKLE